MANQRLQKILAPKRPAWRRNFPFLIYKFEVVLSCMLYMLLNIANNCRLIILTPNQVLFCQHETVCVSMYRIKLKLLFMRPVMHIILPNLAFR